MWFTHMSSPEGSAMLCLAQIHFWLKILLCCAFHQFSPSTLHQYSKHSRTKLNARSTFSHHAAPSRGSADVPQREAEFPCLPWVHAQLKTERLVSGPRETKRSYTRVAYWHLHRHQNRAAGRLRGLLAEMRRCRLGRRRCVSPPAWAQRHVALTLQYQPGLCANRMFGGLLRLPDPTYAKVAALSSLF